MKPQIVIAGSGKMARDVGVFFLGRGHPVAWLSRDPQRLEALERWVRKRIRRQAAFKQETEGEALDAGSPSFFLVESKAIPRAEVFIECINEAEEDKRTLLEALEGVIPDDAIRVTNSSSIFPDALHSECAGLHFFYPVEMTGFVEAVFPSGFSAARRRRLLELLADTQLECIEEGAEAAFAVNRLLLPVQAEAVRLVLAGAEPRALDESSRSEVLPVGQLALMDTIGLDVVYPAVLNFMSRMAREAAAQYEPLRDGLRKMLELGKLGRKNRNGFLLGEQLPWTPSDDGGARPLDEGLADRIRCLFVNTCFHVLERELLSPEKLALALASLFGWERDLQAALEPLTAAQAAMVLEEAYDETGLLYFVPAGDLRAAGARRGWPETPTVV